ncbi:hypothetical protein N665_0903s0007 [Sinapis alba]|nr:hypothetical protein N665_0903s0007 [Sinapis alba]
MKDYWNLMNIPITLSFLFFFVYNFEEVFAAPTMHLCRPEQRDALLNFKNELEVLNSSFVYKCLINGSIVKPHRKTDSWVNNNDCCNWKGITCNAKSGEVIALKLSCSYLHGRFNSYSSLQNLHSLTTLDLSSNVLSGPIMPSIGNLSHLTSLDLSSNRFSGQIPSSIVNLSHLTSLDLSVNNLVGQLPSSFGNLNQLTALDVSSNAFTGTIPFSLFEIPSLQHVRLENNQLNGTLNFGNISSSSKLQELYLKNNNLLGNIPSFICDLRYLITLDLSSNNFSGLIPRCMGNPKCTLLDLNLRQNHLHGDLPKNVCKSLRSLDVSHNQLTGKLPRSWIHLSNLQVLKVESNKISDTFPFWLSSLPELRVLVLCSNAFHGPIHQASFPKLQIIDIAHNHFNGTLPSDYFVKWNAMSSSLGTNDDESIEKYVGDLFYHDSMVLRNKGVEMDIVRIHKILRALDFSGNKLEGEILRSIGLLKEIQVLSLSNNVFNGHIPSSMGNLTSLESLDVSQNQLSGEIPQELGSLSYLAYMNFSHNQLSGLVPGGTQFRRQNCTSFEDNKGLFGPSLDENCIDIHTMPTSPKQHETLEPEVEVLSWTAAVIGAVPGIFFGFTIGYILKNPFGRNKSRRTTTH